MGVELSGGDQQVALGLLLAHLRCLRPDLERGLITGHRVGQGDQGPDPVVHLGEQPRGAGEHAVHEPHRGGRPGQRLQQRHHAVRGNEVHHHQIHREGRQVRAVSDRTRPGPLRPVGGVHRPAPAHHLVLVVLGDPHADLRDLVGLVAVDDPRSRAAARSSPQSHRPSGNRSRCSSGFSVHPRCDPGAPGCLPLGRAGPTRPRFFSTGGVLPGSSSFDGGLEEFPELRESRCSTRASLAARAPLASISSAICPAWRRTSTISSSRDISSGTGTRRSNHPRRSHHNRHAEHTDRSRHTSPS